MSAPQLAPATTRSRVQRPRVLRILTVVAFAASAAALAPSSHAQVPLRFEAPVLLTTAASDGGFEPSLIVDAHDNVWATAHRADAAVRDGRADSGVRTASWLWFSSDGKTFTNPPGLASVNPNELTFGLEGDLAADAKGNVHFVDLATPKVSYTSWRSTGPGAVAVTRSVPALPQPLIDRPFISANGKTVLLAVNDLAGTPTSFSQANHAQGEQQGQYSFYVSKDGGDSFDVRGFHPGSTEFCRPLVSPHDPALLIAACSTWELSGLDDDQRDTGLALFVSRDTGATWTKTQPIKDGVATPFNDFPSITETPSGALHAIYTSMRSPADGSQVLTASRVLLTSSHDRGRTWSSPVDISPEPGLWQHASITSDKVGRLALAGYHRPDRNSPWRFRAAIGQPGPQGKIGHLTSVEVAPGQDAYPASEEKPQGEFTQAAFDGKGSLKVIYGVREQHPLDAAGDGKRISSSKIYFAQQR